jgi:rSAM/selenodomain-associated transferase 2
VRLGIVIPVLDEAATIEPTLVRLAPLGARGARIIVVDGGSADDSIARARPHADRVLTAPRGRALQMNAGARAALENGDVDTLLFLHADSILPADADLLIASALRSSDRCWGRFDVEIAGAPPLLRIVAAAMNWRSRLTGICTGDQAIFITRNAFETLGGFAPIALMEDIEFSRRAKQLTRPAAIAQRVTTSGRRWERLGVLRTIVLMWRLRFAFFRGVDPVQLARRYRDAR